MTALVVRVSTVAIVLQLIIAVLMQWCSNNGLSLISTMSVNNPNF